MDIRFVPAQKEEYAPLAQFIARQWHTAYDGLLGEAQVKYMTDTFQSAAAIERQVREVYQKRPLSESNVSSSGWMLIDFGTVVVHIMTPETRDRYNLEGLWGETPSAEAVRNLKARHP